MWPSLLVNKFNLFIFIYLFVKTDNITLRPRMIQKWRKKWQGGLIKGNNLGCVNKVSSVIFCTLKLKLTMTNIKGKVTI